ncbi:SusC/RagA family TonB-linked outer membrane protein [Sinomicrobium oceani]|nr:SusC/RagA family TonB-linked outer membrane protein [Sinomicrobium oceani]
MVPIELGAQNTSIRIDHNRTISIDELFDIITRQTDYSFIYESEMFRDSPRVELKKGTVTIGSLIRKSLSAQNFDIIFTTNNTIIIKEKTVPQQIKVSGRVSDKNGLPVPGATVLIKGTFMGTSTDLDGHYEIVVSDTRNVLVYSSLGYTTQEVTVGHQSTIDVSLKEEINELDEMVLIGYGKTSKRLATGNVSTITSEDIARQPVTNVLEALQGKVPGMFIAQSNGLPGSKPNVSIRGQVSIASGEQPLYIIDGVPFNASPVNPVTGYGSAAGPIDPLNSINPNDIASITVLKDADATAIYGSRGANGVILIKTKKSRGKGHRLDVNTYTGMGKITNTVSTLSLSQYLNIRQEAFANDGITPTSNNAPDLMDWDRNNNTDFQKEFLENTAQKTEVSASFSGGSDRVSYIFSNTFHEETTVFPGSLGYRRLSSHLGVESTSSDNKFRISVSAFYTKEDNNQSAADLTRIVYHLPPNYPLYNTDGSLYWIPNSDLSNPMSYLMQKSIFKSTNLLANTTISYKITPDLTVTANLGYNKISQTSNIQIPLSSVEPGTADSSTSLFASNYVETFNVEPQLDYVRYFRSGKLSIMLGGSFQASDYVQPFDVRATGYTVDKLLGSLAAAGEITSYTNNFREYNFASVFGRINYVHQNRYLLTLTARRDGSTRFGENKRWGNFGSVGAGWIFSNETWFSNKLPWLSHGKLRGSYGSVGNDQISDYGYLDSYGNWYYKYNDAVIIPQRIANRNYGWETTRKTEVSLETGFFKDRIFLTSSWFRNRTDNQLINAPLPAQTGFDSFQANLPALVESKGMEFELTSMNIQNDNFSWNSAFNITIPRNRLISFPGLENTVYRGIFIEGKPIRNLSGYIFTGLVNGVVTVEDVNNDGEITSGLTETLGGDYKLLDRSTPDFYGGFSNSLTYKNLRLDILLQFVRQMKNGIRENSNIPGTISNFNRDILNEGFRYSQDTGSDAYIAYNNQYIYSNGILSDASFIRLKNVSLSYQFPASLLKSTVIKSAGIALRGQNLLTLTRYDGYDPETGPLSLPPLKMLTVGINCSF